MLLNRPKRRYWTSLEIRKVLTILLHNRHEYARQVLKFFRSFQKDELHFHLFSKWPSFSAAILRFFEALLYCSSSQSTLSEILLCFTGICTGSVNPANCSNI